MTVTLPLPPKSLSPNARISWRSRHRLTKHARTVAKLHTLSALHGNQPPAFHHYSLTFYFPDNRRRDDDNASASCKAYRDGIADALHIDDSTLSLCRAPLMLVDRDNPRVEFHLQA
jgi:crossover junction endodeoxyribonuclease RusA